MGSRSLDRIQSALDELERECCTEAPWYHRLICEMARVPQIFKIDLGTESPRGLRRIIQRSKEDWRFLSMFVDFSVKWSDAEKVVVQDLGHEGSLVVKIYAVAHEMAEDLSQACRKKYIWRKRLEFFNLVLKWKRNIEVFKVENDEAFVTYLSASFHVQSPLDNYSLWTKFLESVSQNLLSLVESDAGDSPYGFPKESYGLYKELCLIQKYLNGVRKLFKYGFPDDNGIEEFLIRVASVVVLTAAWSLNCWFIQRDSMEAEDARLVKFRYLEHEIDPTDPGFMELHLKFLRALNKIRLNCSLGGKPIEPELVDYFLGRTRFDPLYEDLVFLVAFVVNTKLEDSREDVQSFVLETSAFLAEVASEYEPRRKYGNLRVHHTVLHKQIFLLKAEACLKKQVMHAGENQLGELGKTLQYLTQDCSKFGKRSSAILKEVAMEVASLYGLFQAKEITQHGVRNSLLLLLFKILFFKAESFLMELSDADAILIINGKDQIESLFDHLKILRLYVTSQPVKNTDDVDTRLTDIEAIARRITFFSYAFHANKITEEMINNMSVSFSHLLEKIKLFRSKQRELFPFPRVNFPKIHELGFIGLLLGNLGELLKHGPGSFAPVRHHINEIQSDLKSMRSFLVKTIESGTEDPKLKDLVYRVTDVAYRVEYVVESIEIDVEWQHFLWFYDLIEDIRLLKMQTSRMHEMNLGVVVHNVTLVSDHVMSRAIAPEVIVDLNDEEEVIVNRLTRGSSQRDIISIVGMPGIGKTTMAKKVYNNPNITYHFHRRAWCFVSQVHDKRRMLLQILSYLHGLTEEIREMTNEDLESKLRRSLLKRRYLIVMDDVWDIRAWNDLENSFPDDRNGSRILMTSRLRNVVLKAKPRIDPHSLRSLTDEESWELLEKKTFEKEGCPEELLVVAKQIAEHCGGLPLAVVAISGLLHKTEKRRDRWKNIAESLSSRLLNDPEIQCMKILELSYKHLPDYLKACFLYFGAFLGDKDVPVSKLIRLWIAEGFLQETDLNLEEVAEGYLMDLIDRSLVIVSKRRSNGKVKACRLHDLLRDLCHSKAKEGNFLQVVTNCDEPYASFHGSDHGYEPYYSHPLEHVKYESYRLSFFLKRRLFVDSRPSGPCTHSLILFAPTDTYPTCPYDISFLYQNFKLLRVLDLECINIGTSFPDEIGLLVQLRFLALSGDLNFIPRSLANLWKLETLIVKGLRGEVVLPESIWCMARLRCLHVNKYVAFNLQDDRVVDSSQLHNLVSFSCPSFSYGEDTEKIIRRLPNLLKLRCILLESRNSLQIRNQFPRLDSLSQLESLKIIYIGRALNHSGLNLPFSLKELTLSNFHLSQNHISVIGRLLHLKVLKLLSGAFERRKWDMKEEEFQQLKFLKLQSVGVDIWNASSDHLPRLQRLVLQSFEDLEVPYDFANITTLQVIEVQKCGKSTEQSVREIGGATEEIKVIVCHSGSYLGSSP